MRHNDNRAAPATTETKVPVDADLDRLYGGRAVRRAR